MPFQFAISATFTAEPIETVINFWSRQLHWPLDVRFAPFNQVAQALLDPSSVFARNSDGVNVILVRLQDLGPSIHELLDLTVRARRTAQVPFVFVLCPASAAYPIRELAAEAMEAFRNTPGISLLRPEDIERLYPVDEIFNQEGDRLGSIAYTEAYFAALGTALVRLVHALTAEPFKLIALDCDNTLWQGICGEDGADGILIDASRRALQEFMISQRDSGMLLALASKNNEGDVLETFERNPNMPLQLESFVARRLNWDPKSTNLASLAEELSLSAESFVFIDDNPLEAAEVQENLPQVLSLTLPADAARIVPFLHHVWAFDHPVVTAEDRRRSESYAQTLAFGRELQTAGSMEHFLETLNLRVAFVSPDSGTIGRIAQLTQRTNQFNFTTIRRTAAEISTLIASGAWECRGVEVADRFGEYGLTGVLIFRVAGGDLEVDTFLLSCRVLGRGVEHRMMVRLAEEALVRGANTVVARIRTTARNEPARQFLHSIAAEFEEFEEGGAVYRMQAAVASRGVWKPAIAASPASERKAEQPRSHNRPDYEYVAKHLSSAAQILAAIRAEARGGQSPASADWKTDTEAALANIWSELLRNPDIKPADNFFDLGGHSLLVVLLIVRVRETLGVELPIEDVYSGDMTLRALAASIDRRKAGEHAEYEALIDEIGRMSDEEVERLLAEEDPGVSFS